MKNQLKIIALLLVLVLCLSAAACAMPQDYNETTPVGTPEASTPIATPEVSTPLVTPEETTPIATPDESTPAITPEETTPVETPEETTTEVILEESTPAETTPSAPDYTEIPVAENDLTGGQMAEIEAAFGSEIDWDKYYFGIYDGYVYFGTSDGSEEYYWAKNSKGTKVYFGYVNAVYTFKDGVISDAGSTFVTEKISMDMTLIIGGNAIKKTLGELPNVDDDLTEEDRAAIREHVEFYYGVYNGYAVWANMGVTGEGVVIGNPGTQALKLLNADNFYTYKEGEVKNYINNQNLPEGVLTKEDIIRIQFVHYALYADLYVKPYM